MSNGTGEAGLPEEVGGVKVSDMPIGPDALNIPGRRDGQTKMVKWPAKNKITAHSWSEGNLITKNISFISRPHYPPSAPAL